MDPSAEQQPSATGSESVTGQILYTQALPPCVRALPVPSITGTGAGTGTGYRYRLVG